MKKKTAELHLGYFKRGDDLRGFLESNDDICGALTDHSTALSLSVKLLSDLSDKIKTYKNYNNKFDIEAYTHTILVTGPEKYINELIALGLLEEIDYLDDIFPDEEDMEEEILPDELD